MAKERTGAELVVKCPEAHGVTQLFGIPGAKVDAVFNALVASTIELIVCRHEQNAAFMAAAVGRRTGKAGHTTSAQKNIVLAGVGLFFGILGTGPWSLTQPFFWGMK